MTGVERDQESVLFMLLAGQQAAWSKPSGPKNKAVSSERGLKYNCKAKQAQGPGLKEPQTPSPLKLGSLSLWPAGPSYH